MAENTFLTAKEMAQELVRNRVEPDSTADLLGYLQEHKEEGIAGLLGHIQGGETGESLQAASTSFLGNLDDVDSALDVLGWTVGFMRYYRGEGNRPQPNQRPSEPRRSRPPARRRTREQQRVTVPIETLQEGQQLAGVVRRIMPYGVFVAVGAERDGLVHVSELQNSFTGDPADVVSVDETVQVWVKSIDLEKKRISLTMKGAEAAVAPEPERPQQSQAPQHQRQVQQPPQQQQRQDRRSGPRRRSAPRERASESARLYADEEPKEMSALGEALRLALAKKEAGDEERPDDSRQKKSDKQSTELAEALRRTLYG